MYRSCIFCSAHLGSNESIEQFPVGRSLAFDAARGRLWAVCPKCARWNLAPLEERWEAIEAGERLFRDARSRSQGENIGLAKLPGGTRLIRIGEAHVRELAAWRYGRRMVRRHLADAARSSLEERIGTGVSAGLLLGGYALAAMVYPLVLYGYVGAQWISEYRRLNRVVHVVHDGPADPTQRIVIRREDLDGGRLSEPDDGLGMQLFLPYSRVMRRGGAAGDEWGRFYVKLRGGEAESVLRRVIVHLNDRGAPERSVDCGVQLVEEAGSAQALVRKLAETNRTLPEGGNLTLALEMALHEETERRAMEGELAILEAMWREAEAIAAIADRLPGAADPPRIGARGAT
jgi:hypothetical protein